MNLDPKNGGLAGCVRLTFLAGVRAVSDLNPALLFAARDAAVAEVYANSRPAMSDEEWRRFLPVLLLALNSHARCLMVYFELREKGDE
jgi:hypothetical protein